LIKSAWSKCSFSHLRSEPGSLFPIGLVDVWMMLNRANLNVMFLSAMSRIEDIAFSWEDGVISMPMSLASCPISEIDEG